MRMIFKKHILEIKQIKGLLNTPNLKIHKLGPKEVSSFVEVSTSCSIKAETRSPANSLQIAPHFSEAAIEKVTPTL